MSSSSSLDDHGGGSDGGAEGGDAPTRAECWRLAQRYFRANSRSFPHDQVRAELAEIALPAGTTADYTRKHIGNTADWLDHCETNHRGMTKLLRMSEVGPIDTGQDGDGDGDFDDFRAGTGDDLFEAEVRWRFACALSPLPFLCCFCCVVRKRGVNTFRFRRDDEGELKMSYVKTVVDD